MRVFFNLADVTCPVASTNVATRSQLFLIPISRGIPKDERDVESVATLAILGVEVVVVGTYTSVRFLHELEIFFQSTVIIRIEGWHWQRF